ncbi:MAG: protease complex subunit PrcB family protein [Planctomycetota bacterium]
MLTPALLAATLTCTPLFFAGCAGGGASESSAPAVKMMAEAVPIIAKVSGDQLLIESHGLGVIYADALDGLGLREAFAQAGADVDLSQHSVILFSLGEQPTGGFSADINGLQIKGKQVYVQGTAVAPGPNTVVTQALTYPYCAVAVEKLPSGVTLLSDITSLP